MIKAIEHIAIVAADPFNPKARYYLGLEKAQAGNVRPALQAWVDLAALSVADASWLDAVYRKIAAAKELGLDPAQVKPSARALALSLTKGLGENEVGLASRPGHTAHRVRR